MTAERLAEIRQEVRWWLDGKVHTISEDVVEELLAEVERLHAVP